MATRRLLTLCLTLCLLATASCKGLGWDAQVFGPRRGSSSFGAPSPAAFTAPGGAFYRGVWKPDCFAGIERASMQPVTVVHRGKALDLTFGYDFAGFFGGEGTRGTMTLRGIPVTAAGTFQATRYADGQTTIVVRGTMQGSSSVQGTIDWDSLYPLVQGQGPFQAVAGIR